MKNMITSTIQVQMADPEKTLGVLENFKKAQDIPCEHIDISAMNDKELYELRIQYPLYVFDESVTQFMAILFGEMPFMRAFDKFIFKNIEVPEEVYGWFQGPRFGANGIKNRFDLNEFPLIMGIIKPSLDVTRDIASQRCKLKGVFETGLHAVKDDEIQGNLPNMPLEARLALAAERKGYVPTVNIDNIGYLGRILSDERLSMVIINATILGFPIVNQLCRITKVPLLSHLSLQGTYNGTFHPALYAFLHRLFGCDAFITAIGDSGYYAASKEMETDMVTSLTCDLPIRKTLPMLAGGAKPSNVGKIMEVYEKQNIPYGIVFGSYIYGSDETPQSRAADVVNAIEAAKLSMH